jgi:hypothetical protein
MGKLKSPKSNRATYKVKIGNRNVVSRLKITTGNYLGLKKESELVDGKKKSIVDGSMGTKSFQLVFKKAITIDGVKVQRLSFPVDGKVTVKQFYSYAKSTFSAKGVGAIISPDGIQRAWDKIERSKSGGLIPGLPNLPSLPGIDLSDLVSPDVGAAVGGYLGGNLGGTTGAAIGSALGGYLAGYI